jgi:DNA-binding LacI/PurR family transcriptional regulator
MAVIRATAHDVAQLAGVSQTTVSLVLNDVPSARISEEVRRRVREAAKSLDYHPNASAQSLRRRKTRTIGLVIPDSKNPHFWQIAVGVERRAAEQGYNVLLGSTDLGFDRERLVLQSLKQQQIDGLIVQVQFPSESLREIQAWGHSIVRIGAFSAELDGVVPDYGVGCLMLMEHLVGLGHRRIGFVFGTTAPGWPKPEVGLGQDRLMAYWKAVGEHSLASAPELVQYCGPRPDDACEATRRLLALEPRPSAVVCINDYLAFAVVKTIMETGLRVPKDISVAGFDDIPLARYLSPALTTVRANAEMLGEKAVELLLGRLENRGMPPQHCTMPTSLVIRESTEVCADVAAWEA